MVRAKNTGCYRDPEYWEFLMIWKSLKCTSRVAYFMKSFRCILNPLMHRLLCTFSKRAFQRPESAVVTLDMHHMLDFCQEFYLYVMVRQYDSDVIYMRMWIWFENAWKAILNACSILSNMKTLKIQTREGPYFSVNLKVKPWDLRVFIP